MRCSCCAVSIRWCFTESGGLALPTVMSISSIGRPAVFT
jgi:hypothetical protein